MLTSLPLQVQRHASSLLSSVLGPLMLALTSLIVLLPFSRLDFDVHHDGYMLGQAMALAEGGFVHRDVFAQYGPLTPLIQSVFLQLPLAPALALRLSNVFFISLTIFLVADLSRVSPASWRISRRSSWLGAVAWLVLADVLVGIPMLPWSSVIASSMVILSLYCVAIASGKFESGRSGLGGLWALAAGAVIALVPFTRINVGLVALAVTLTCLTIYFWLRLPGWGALWSPFVVGLVTTIVAIFLWLYWHRAWDDYVQQAIVEPLRWSRDATPQWNPVSNLTQMFAVQVPAFLVLFLTVWLSRHLPQMKTRGNAHSFWVLFLGGTLIAAYEFSPVLPVALDLLQSSPLDIADARQLAQQISMRNLSFFMFLVVIFAFGRSIPLISKLPKNGFAAVENGASTLLIAGLSLALLIQVFPTWDSRHVWWGLPLGLVFIFVSIDQLLRIKGETRILNPLLPLLAAIGGMSIAVGAAYLSYPRAELAEVPVLKGMRLLSESALKIEQDKQLLDRLISPNGETIFFVNQGHYSVIQGEFRSADPHFVYWGDLDPLLKRVESLSSVVLERDIANFTQIQAQLKQVGFKQVGSNDRIAILARQ